MSNPPTDRFLQLSSEDMRALGYKVIDILIEHFECLKNKPVTRTTSRSVLEERLQEPLPQQGSSPEKVIEQLQQDVFSNIMHLDHPRFFAFIPSPSNFVSVMADVLASGFNVFAGTWLEASGAAELEIVTIDWLRQLFGLPQQAGGLCVSGGSVANLTALAAARHMKLRDNIQDAVVYCSDQTHSSIERALHILGFTSKQIRKLPTDEEFRLEPATVQHEIAADRVAGRIPFCIIANLGTTNSGAIDPLPALAELCQREDLWLHVDGAYGAAAVLSDKGAWLLEGLKNVDSLSFDPHKWLFQPYEIGCVLVRERNWLKETFQILPEFLQDAVKTEEELNFCDYGLQLTRGFRALKLWMSLKVFGLDAFRQAVTRGIILAERAEEILRCSSCWEIVTSAQLGIVTFRYMPYQGSLAKVDVLNQQLLTAMIADGFAMISSTKLRGRVVLRLCTINPRTEESDIQETIQRLETIGERLCAQ
ncbi:MAG: pyridoxal phosphate-dependent decarboxylase family protein [Ktedonobacteraceae bacterium]